MNYESRMKIVGDWLAHFLSQLKPPSHLEGEQVGQEAHIIAEAANGVIPTALTEEAIRERLRATTVALRRTMTTRGWPTPAEVVRAINAAEPSHPDDDQSLADENMMPYIINWFRKYREPAPGMGGPHRTQKLIDLGEGTPREFYRAGFPMPAWYDHSKTQPSEDERAEMRRLAEETAARVKHNPNARAAE